MQMLVYLLASPYYLSIPSLNYNGITYTYRLLGSQSGDNE
jgi:hypothetical protein